MSKHVTNILRIEGQPDKVKAVLEAIQSERGPMDFTRFADIPEVVKRLMKMEWNAYDSELIMENVIRFVTAQKPPIQIMEVLSKQHPDVLINVEFAGDDIGNTVGHFTLKNGRMIDHWSHADGSISAFQNARHILKEDYYITEYLCGLTDEEVANSRFADKIIADIHRLGLLNSNYPKSVLEALKQLALAEEQYERVMEIDVHIASKALTPKED